MYPRVKVREQEEPVAIQEEETSYMVQVIESLSLESHCSSRIQVSNHGSRHQNDSHPPHARISKSNPNNPIMPSTAASKGKKNNGFDEDKQSQNESHPPHARISKSHPKNSLTPPIAASKGKNSNGVDEDNKTNIGASSVPRPRAVLSSPDNDGIIGSQNQRTRERRTPLRKQTLNNDGTTGQQNQVIREKRTLPKRQTLSSNTQAQGKAIYSSVRVESPLSTRKLLKEASNSSILKKKHSSELSSPRQRPPFKVG